MDEENKSTPGAEELADDIGDSSPADGEESACAADGDEGRPPVDPKNKLYIFLSLLIFAAGYVGFHYLAENFSPEAAYFLENIPPEAEQVIAGEVCGTLPEGSGFLYARLHRNFDDNALYCAFSLPGDIEESSDFEDYIPYEFGDRVEDERFSILPEASMTADYVFGDCYVCRDDPKIYCVVYEDGGQFTAVFRTTVYSGRVKEIFRDAVRINARMS